ncbi:MAG: glycogen/starch synthase [Clostridia bacterium]|nr:glycogen/starch synthase [Clostridia bacterium]
MRILFVTSECAPYSKSGGLADVAFSLPPALKKTGDEVAVITPLYQCVRKNYGDTLTRVAEITVRLGWRERIYCGLWRGELSGVTVYFVDNLEFFDRPKLYGYGDDPLRFAFFSRAVISLLPQLDFMPQILHCNDWETALTVIYLKDEQVVRPELRNIRAVYTIHNIAYQGQFGENLLQDVFGLDQGWYDGGLGYEFEGRRDVNLMKGAMMMADAVSTVSPNYAREMHSDRYGCGLQGVADIVGGKLYGILNGIDMDRYDPSKCPNIPAHFSRNDISGKAQCKRRLQELFGLHQEARWPLLCCVSRLVEQKGIELIRQVLPGLMDLGVQLIVFGQGDQQYLDYFDWAKRTWPGQVGFSSDYSEPMADAVFAGSDMYLMPSRFEPCGLSQMMAMRFGTVPIVHETGGLKDSVRPYSGFDGLGDGFAFVEYSAHALYVTCREAIRLYFGDRKMWAKLMDRGMRKDFSWDRSAERYNRMYEGILDNREEADVPFDEAFETLKAAWEEIDRENLARHPDDFNPHYRRTLEITLTGRAEGKLNIRFADGAIHVNKGVSDFADAFAEATYDNFLDMASGRVSPDTLFLNGQLKITGNLAKGYEFRMVLSPAPQQESGVSED